MHAMIVSYTIIAALTGAMSAIVITQEPQDLTVYEGESVSFSCLYYGTNEHPIWYINGLSYPIQGLWLGLPERHIYFNQTMTVRDVDSSNNGTTYRCSFYSVTSQTATLTVIPAPQGA